MQSALLELRGELGCGVLVDWWWGVVVGCRSECVTMLCMCGVVVMCSSVEVCELFTSEDVRASELRVYVRVSALLVSRSGKSGAMCRVCSSG